MKRNSNFVTFIICYIIGFLIGLGAIYLFYIIRDKDKNIEPPTPVEESRIDTLYLTRDSLIYYTQYLDSIKHDTIEKVYKLNDTATLKLFLQLVSE